jgi:hypothetical protein
MRHDISRREMERAERDVYANFNAALQNCEVTTGLNYEDQTITVHVRAKRPTGEILHRAHRFSIIEYNLAGVDFVTYHAERFALELGRAIFLRGGT